MTDQVILRRHASRWATLALGIAALLPVPAKASTASFTFTQSGFVDQAGDQGTLTGTFSGTPEIDGTIQLADLASFSATLRETVGNVPENFLFNTPAAFLYDPNSPDTLEFSSGSGASGIQLCSGSNETNFTCLGLSPGGPIRSAAVGFFEDLPSFGPSMTLQAASIISNGSTVPEPSTGAMFLTAAGLLLLSGCLRAGRASVVRARFNPHAARLRRLPKA